MNIIKTILVIAIWGVNVAGTAWAAAPMPVFVSILPQKYFVQQIGGELISVQAMVQPGASPATYEPKPKQLADLTHATLYFAVGVPFEQAWLSKIAAANPKMRVIHTDEGIEKRPMAAHHHHEADGKPPAKTDHHDDHLHHKEGRDPHIWLAPSLVKRQAGTIADALKKADPANAAQYEANYRSFISTLTQLDTELKEILKEKQGLQFMVFHPSWGYFAQAYGLTQIPIEIEGKDPKPAQLKKLIQHARAEEIKIIFAQPQFSSKSAKLIAREIGGQVVFADPLAEDWMANMRKVASEFRSALK